jgi:DNA gyrase/topoisomerase IV subunit B
VSKPADPIEAIRRRPHEVAGKPDDTPPGGAYWLAARAALALADARWGATRVQVHLRADGACAIDDDGPGLAIEPVEDQGVVRARFDRVMSTVTTGAAEVLAPLGPLDHLGGRLAALCDELVVETVRAGALYRAVCLGGRYHTWLHRVGEAGARRGTSLALTPLPALRPKRWRQAGLLSAIAHARASEAALAGGCAIEVVEAWAGAP